MKGLVSATRRRRRSSRRTERWETVASDCEAALVRGHYQIRDDSGGCPMGSNFGTVHQSIRHYSEGCNYWVKKLQSAQNDDN